MQTSLKLSRACLSELYDKAPVGYLSVNEMGVIVNANLTAANHLGVPRDSMPGLPLSRFLLPEDLSRYDLLRKQLKEQDGQQKCELRMLRLGKQPFWARLEGTASHNQRDGTLHLIVFISIINDRLMKEELQGLEKQLSEGGREKQLERITSGAIHNLNNMLTVIRGYAEMSLNNMHPNQPIFTNLQQIIKAVDRSSEFTRKLFSNDSRLNATASGIDLNQTVEDQLPMIQEVVGQDIDLVWTPGSKLWPVNVDTTQVEQILINLCANGRDALEGKGQVAIETKNTSWKAAYNLNHAVFPPGDYVALVITDNGCGMAGEAVEQMFEPCSTTMGAVKCSADTRLANVYSIVKQNNGSLHVYSEPERGTAFKIYLPRYAPRN